MAASTGASMSPSTITMAKPTTSSIARMTACGAAKNWLSLRLNTLMAYRFPCVAFGAGPRRANRRAAWSRCDDVDDSADGQFQETIGAILVDGEFDQAIGVLVPEGRADRHRGKSPRPRQHVLMHRKPRIGCDAAGAETGHRIAEMINVNNLAEVGGPAGLHTLGERATHARRRFATREAGGHGCEQIAAVERRRQLRRPPLDVPPLRLGRARRRHVEEAVVGAHQPAAVHPHRCGTTCEIAHTWIVHAQQHGAWRKLVDVSCQLVGGGAWIMARRSGE